MDNAQVFLGGALGELGVLQKRRHIHSHAAIHPEAMLEAGVHRPRIYQVGRAELAHPAQPLERRMIDDRAHPTGDGHVSTLGHTYRAYALVAGAEFRQRRRGAERGVGEWRVGNARHDGGEGLWGLVLWGLGFGLPT